MRRKIVMKTRNGKKCDDRNYKLSSPTRFSSTDFVISLKIYYENININIKLIQRVELTNWFPPPTTPFKSRHHSSVYEVFGAHCDHKYVRDTKRVCCTFVFERTTAICMIIKRTYFEYILIFNFSFCVR